MKPQLIIRAIFFTLLLPGTVTFYVPFTLLRGSINSMSLGLSPLKVLAIFIGVIGSLILLHCIWAFAFYGKGTLAPIDPPEKLVVHGLYKYSRNPMYHAVLLVLTSETIFFQSLSLLYYTAIVFLAFFLFVLVYEEPYLRNHFGDQYLDYCRQVPRWGMTMHSYKNNTGAA